MSCAPERRPQWMNRQAKESSQREEAEKKRLRGEAAALEPPRPEGGLGVRAVEELVKRRSRKRDGLTNWRGKR